MPKPAYQKPALVFSTLLKNLLFEARFKHINAKLIGRRKCSKYQYSLNKLRVAYNDAFRQLLQEPRWCSASKLFVLNSVSSLPENKRKLIYSLWRSLQISDNSLVKAVLSSDLFFNSPLFKCWRSSLF